MLGNIHSPAPPAISSKRCKPPHFVLVCHVFHGSGEQNSAVLFLIQLTLQGISEIAFDAALLTVVVCRAAIIAAVQVHPVPNIQDIAGEMRGLVQ